MKRFTFEEFLQEQHAENYHGTDDAMPDAFDAWLTDLQADDFIKYADEALFKARVDEIHRAIELIADNKQSV